jgi:hypothetical protein
VAIEGGAGSELQYAAVAVGLAGEVAVVVRKLVA